MCLLDDEAVVKFLDARPSVLDGNRSCRSIFTCKMHRTLLIMMQAGKHDTSVMLLSVAPWESRQKHTSSPFINSSCLCPVAILSLLWLEGLSVPGAQQRRTSAVLALLCLLASSRLCLLLLLVTANTIITIYLWLSKEKTSALCGGHVVHASIKAQR